MKIPQVEPNIILVPNENSDFQYIEALSRNRTKRHRAGEFFVEGVRAITQAVNFHWEVSALIYSRDRRLSDWAERILERAGAARHYVLTPELLLKLSQKEDGSEMLALVVIPPDDFKRLLVGENPLVVVLDRPASPGNLGSIIRSADALAVDGLVVSGHAADLYDPETIRATTGSFFAVPVVRVDSHQELQPWLERLRQRFPDLCVVGTTAHAETTIDTHDFNRPTVLLVGNENHGLSANYRALSDALVTIPMVGSATSLNLASATSILLYEIGRQRKRK